MPTPLRLTLIALLLAGLAGCQGGTGVGGETGPVRDESRRAIAVLSTATLDQLQPDRAIDNVGRPWVPVAWQALAAWPSEADVNLRIAMAYEPTAPGSPLDVPELMYLLGVLHLGGYDELPVETYIPAALKRFFASDALLFPDWAAEDPPGIPAFEILSAAHDAARPVLQPLLRERLTNVFGTNPGAFTPRDPRWGRLLLEGEVGKINTTPEQMFHEACLAAVTHQFRQFLPAFNKVADDRGVINEYRCSAALAACLLAEDRAAAQETFKARIFKDRYLSQHFDHEAYRLLSVLGDEQLYTTIRTALDTLPAAQHLDYGEYLARYGKPEDLPRVIELISQPVDYVEQRLTTVRSLRLLDPLTGDTGAVTQPVPVLTMREAIAKKLSDEAAGRQSDAEIVLPTTVTTNPEEARKLADELKVPLHRLRPASVPADQIKAERLWWLRHFPISETRLHLSQVLRRGSLPERLVALRLLGWYGGEPELPLLAAQLGHKDRLHATEAAVWYLAIQRRWKLGPFATAPETDSDSSDSPAPD